MLSIDDTLLKHYGQKFEHIAKLYDHVISIYVWAHNLVTLQYSDDYTDYPVLFELWKPVDIVKLEEGMRDAGVPIKASKEPLKESAPAKWRSYLVIGAELLDDHYRWRWRTCIRSRDDASLVKVDFEQSA